jgi:hypothetical protein
LRPWNSWKRIPKGVYAAICGLAVLVGLLVLYPWLSLEQGERLRPMDPFGIVLNVSNDGYIPMTDVSVVCAFDMVDEMGNTFTDVSGRFGHVAKSLPFRHRLSLPCFKAVSLEGVRPRQVKLKAIVSYDIWHFPFRRTQEFILKGEPDSRGEWHWLFGG